MSYLKISLNLTCWRKMLFVTLLWCIWYHGSRTRYAGHCWRSRDELISDVLLWISTYGRAKVGWLARTYIQQLCEDTGCSPDDLPEAMNDREKWRERVRDIHASGTTWWWWWFDINIMRLLQLPSDYLIISFYFNL